MSRWSLTTRLVVLLTSCIALTLGATSAGDYLMSRGRILQEVEQAADNKVAEAVNDLEVRLASLEESTELLAEVIQLENYSESQLSELLREAVDDREDIFGAAVALNPRWASDPVRGFAPYYHYQDGELVFADLTSAYDYVLSSWYREPASTGSPVWTEPYYDDGGGNVLMSTYAVPLFRDVDGERAFYGVVTADITLDELQYYVDRMALGESGFGFVLSRSGRLMAAPNPEYLLRPLLQILPSGQDLERWAELLIEVGNGLSTSIDVPCALTGERCLLKVAPLASTGWPVGVYYSEYEMLAPLRAYLAKSALTTGLTLVLLLFGVVWVSRRITRPLRALALATVDIATGNFRTTLPQARTGDELGQLVHAFSVMQQNLQRFVTELEAETASRSRLLGELNAATEIQMAMLPGAGRANLQQQDFALWAGLRPAKSVGGDLYDFHSEDPDRLLIAVGDVSDKGVPAALFMARAMTLLQQYTRSVLSADKIMAQLNEELVEGNDNCMFVTLFLGWLDRKTLELSFASGGHTAPLLLRNGAAGEMPQHGGPALGLMEDAEFPLNHARLADGDLLAVFTDGVDEAFNAQGDQFQVSGLQRVLEEEGEAPLDTIGQAAFDAIDDFAGDIAQHDDITLLLLRLGRGGEAAAGLALASDDKAAGTLLPWLRQRLESAGFGQEFCSEALLVAEEAATNIVKYAGLDTEQSLEVRVWHDDGSLTLEFRDPGIAFDPLTEARRAALGEDSSAAEIGGLGVHLLEALTDEQAYQRVDGFNILRLVKYSH